MHKPLADALDALDHRGLPARPLSSVIRDFITLMKPSITLHVVITAAGGLFLAKRAGRIDGAEIGATTILATLIGTALVVAGANTLNMYIERDSDRHMARTKNRPLPSGRMAAPTALWFGVGLSALSVPILAIGANPLTALLAVIANLLYVLAYTPLKRQSQYALHVGAIPGAIPPLLGWTAGTARIDAAGLVLFSILFLWQIPHFAAITIYRKNEYARAGLVVMANVEGDLASKHVIVRWIFAGVAASLLVVPLGLAGQGYFIAATALGVIYFAWGCYGLRRGSGNRWARTLFGVSSLYLVLLFAALAINP